MELVVTVVGKEIKQDKSSFVAYALLSAAGNWYRVAGIEPKALEKFDRKVAVITASRKFNKEVKGDDGKMKLFPTLVVTAVREPTSEEEADYVKKLDKINSATLADVK